jgi:hypothetical protein
MKVVTSFLILFSGCCLSVTVMPTRSGAAGEKQTGVVDDKLRTPPEGSAERQALMDALRQHWKSTRNPENGQPYRGKITFRVGYLKVHHGWAWTYAEPHSSAPREGFPENDGLLLHLEEGRWKVMKLPPMDDNGDGAFDPSLNDVKRIKEMYRSIPTDIIPGARRR